jgi:DNA-binding NarL/FixJ family response regulator
VLPARGLSNAELAADLHLSEAMVKTQVARILGNLHLMTTSATSTARR